MVRQLVPRRVKTGLCDGVAYSFCHRGGGLDDRLPGSCAVPAPALPPDRPKSAKDPIEIVCERQAVVGSRLAAAKVCHTRVEWGDLRSSDRHMVDQAQI